VATNTATNSVQDGRVGVQMSAWYGAVLPADVLHANLVVRSAASGLLSVPRTTTNYGDRSFAVSGPTVWNSLPAAPTGHVTFCLPCTAENISHDISCNACNSRHGAFAASFEFAPYK